MMAFGFAFLVFRFPFRLLNGWALVEQICHGRQI